MSIAAAQHSLAAETAVASDIAAAGSLVRGDLLSIVCRVGGIACAKMHGKAGLSGGVLYFFPLVFTGLRLK